jgi:hypothetical protein
MYSHMNTRFRAPIFFLTALALTITCFALFARGGTTYVPENMDRGISCDSKKWSSGPYFTNDPSGCPDLIEYLFKPAYVDEKASEFTLRFITLPSGKFGSPMRNSGWVMTSYMVDVDTTDSVRIENKNGSTSRGATLRAKISNKNSFFFYPFDRYEGEIQVQAIEELSKSKIPGTLIVSDSSLSGWKLKFGEAGVISEETDEKALYVGEPATLTWELGRANTVYIAVGILLILMLIALVSAFAITRTISRKKRPPSMNLLMWLATILFAILQVRTNFPGNPPVGIFLDFAVVFPVLGFLLIIGIANTFFWLNRTDWDYENEIPVMESDV